VGEAMFQGVKKRSLQALARGLPGATTVRPMLHRWRGVHVGTGVFISTDVLVETSYPELVSIGDRVFIGIRSVIIAHFREEPRPGYSVRIEDDVFIGPGVIILPNVTIGHGAVITAGSVITRSVPPLTMVQGNPGVPVARSRVPLGSSTAPREYYRSLTPIRQRSRSDGQG
jgi:acetyltransferase-like isoleucine patch superfamily enzyme